MILKGRKGTDLFSRFKQSVRTILLDPNQTEKIEYSSDEKLAVVLSPSLYWVKKLSISVKYLRDVKKLLPSIFEEILPDGNYSYTAYKEGNEYFAFAYQDREIIELLKQRGISLGDVDSIRFAQSELKNLQKPYRLNEDEVIYVQDGVVILAPKEWFDEVESLNIDNIPLSKQTVQLQQFNHIVDNKSLYRLAYLMLFFILILSVELLITKTKIASLESKRVEIFKNYKLKPTMMQNRAILQKYEKIDKVQRALRKYIAEFLKISLKDGESLRVLEYKNKKLRLLFEGLTPQRVQRVAVKLRAKEPGVKIEKRDNSLSVEVEL